MKLSAYLQHATMYRETDEFEGYLKTVRLLADAGFDAYDFALFANLPVRGSVFNGPGYADYAKRLREEADRAGLRCNQTHAPFYGYCTEHLTWEQYTALLPRALEVTAILGGEICVVHPERTFGPEENAERLYRPLTKYAEKYDIRIALENLWMEENGHIVPCACSTPESYLAHLRLLDPARFVACLDIGHAEILGDTVSAVSLIHALGDRLQAIHVHDNDLVSDLHQMPYCGKIDWDGVLGALKKIGYRGTFTFEVGQERFPLELAKPAAVLLCAIGRHMIEKLS